MGLYFPSSASGGATAVNLTQVAGNNVATAATGIQKVGITDSTGNALTSTTGSLNVNLTSATNITTGPALNRVTGTISATGTGNGFLVNIANYTSLNIRVSGTYSGATIQFLSSLAPSGTPSDAFQVLKYPAGGIPVTSDTPGTNATAQYVANAAGPQQLLIYASALTSGSISVEVNETTDPISIGQTVQIGNNPFVQGTKTFNNAAPGSNWVSSLVAISNAASPSYTEGFSQALSMDNSGNLRTFNVAAVTGGYTPGSIISANTTNGTSVKASAGTLGYVHAGNNLGTVAYAKFYNKASSPTVGTDVPVQVLIIPGNTAGAGVSMPLPPQGAAFSIGIALAITGGAANSDTTSVGTSQVNLSYGTV